MKKLDLSGATEAAGAGTVVAAQREGQPAVTDSQETAVSRKVIIGIGAPSEIVLADWVWYFPVTVADYISRPESQSRQNLPQKENHSGPEPKVNE